MVLLLCLLRVGLFWFGFVVWCDLIVVIYYVRICVVITGLLVWVWFVLICCCVWLFGFC